MSRSVLVGIACLVAGCASTPRPATPPTQQNVVVLTGRADAAESGLSIETGDWTYGGGFGFMWVDADGVWHEDGRPDCLPAGQSRMVRFAATEVTVDGTWRPIVRLDCR